MRYWDKLAEFQRSNFTVIVDKSWEDIDVGDCFDDTCYDIQDMRNKINSGDLDWFMLRVRVMFEGHEFGSAYLGGMLYENASECLTDGTAEDVIDEAMDQAKKEIERMASKIWACQRDLDAEDAMDDFNYVGSRHHY